MKTIWKYELEPSFNLISKFMPAGAKVLSVDSQDGNIFLWAEIDTDYIATKERFFKVVGTGWNYEENAGITFIGSVKIEQTTLGTLIFHVFELVGYKA
jgi:hypothetical protein